MVFGIDVSYTVPYVVISYLVAVTAVLLYFAVLGTRQEARSSSTDRTADRDEHPSDAEASAR